MKSNNLALFSVAVFSLVVFAEPAFANPTAIETTLCKVLAILTGKAGKAIAAFALVFLGISLFMGKVSWGLAISTALGIATIFGAPALVTLLGAGGTTLAVDESGCTAG